MALWGRADSIYSPGTVKIDYENNIITGTGTSFNSATVGNIITIGVGATFGEAVISGITSERVISIARTESLTGDPTPTGVGYSISQKPVYTLRDSNYGEVPIGVGTINSVCGVDQYEVASAVNTKYAVAHGGWVGIHTYIDQHGELRVKSEVLVAMSGITTGTASYGVPGDAADDTAFPDEVITINTQPAGVGIGTTELPYDATFTVSASVIPGATLFYQWQYASSVGAGYTNLSDNSTYSGTATAGLGVTITDDTIDGYLYRSIITTSGGALEISNSALLTVTP